MKGLLFLFSIALLGCFTEKHNLKSSVDYDKIILAEEVSLFGEFKYKPAVKSKNNIQLLYKNGTLKYITSGHKRLNKTSSIQTVRFISDTLTVLTRLSKGVHDIYDTVFIMPSAYYAKRVDHCGEHASRVHYTTYTFTRKHLILNSDFIHTGDTHFAQAFQSYIQKPLKGRPDTLYKYENVGEEKMKFLSQFIYYLN